MPPPPRSLAYSSVAYTQARFSQVLEVELFSRVGLSGVVVAVGSMFVPQGPAVLSPMNSAPLAGFDCSWDAERQGLLLAEEVLGPPVLSRMNSPPSLVHLAGFDCSWDAERRGLLLLARDEQSLPIQQVVEWNTHVSKRLGPCGTDLAPRPIAKPQPESTLLHGPPFHPPSEGP